MLPGMEESWSLGPWLPPTEPPLPRLAWEAADAEGIASLTAWPEVEGNGVRFGELPVFLCWLGRGEGDHLMFFQASELGAVVPGARPARLPRTWLEDLDLPGLARPFARHPGLSAGVAVHVVQVQAPGRARVRGSAPPPAILAQALERFTGFRGWVVEGVL